MNPQQLIETAEAKTAEADRNLVSCVESINAHRDAGRSVPTTDVIMLAHAQAGVASATSALAMAKAGVSMAAAEEARSTAAAEAAVAAVQARIAAEIRAELVCCNTYDEDSAETTKHQICYWGEAAARLADPSDG